MGKNNCTQPGGGDPCASNSWTGSRFSATLPPFSKELKPPGKIQWGGALGLMHRMRHLAISYLKVSKNILEEKSLFFFQGWMVNGDDPTGVTFSLGCPDARIWLPKYRFMIHPPPNKKTSDLNTPKPGPLKPSSCWMFLRQPLGPSPCATLVWGLMSTCGWPWWLGIRWLLTSGTSG